MRASQVLAATAGDHSIILVSKEGDDINLIASTLPVGAEPGKYGLHSLLIAPPQKDEKGLVAVAVGTCRFSGKSGHWSCIPFFLQVSWVNGEPRIDLENAFIPPQGRLGRIERPSTIEVLIDGVWFSNDLQAKEKRIVPDTTLLCKYLAGLASEDEVLAAASELIRQQNLDEKYQALLTAHRDLQIKQEEMSGLSLQLDYVQSLLTIAEGEKEDLAEKLKTRMDAYNETVEELRTANENLARISNMTRNPVAALWNWTDIRWIFEKPDDKDQG